MRESQTLTPERPLGCRARRTGTLRALERPGSDLLSRVLGRSTIGAEGLHGRVRHGIGCGPLAIATRSSKRAKREAWFNSPGGRPGGCWVQFDPAGSNRVGLVRPWRIEPWRQARPAGRGLDPGHEWRRLKLDRAIRTGQLHALPRFHTRPINVVVFHGSRGRPGLEGGFPLRCLQRLSRPNLATRRCRWRDNRYTRGSSTPVLSY